MAPPPPEDTGNDDDDDGNNAYAAADDWVLEDPEDDNSIPAGPAGRRPSSAPALPPRPPGGTPTPSSPKRRSMLRRMMSPKGQQRKYSSEKKSQAKLDFASSAGTLTYDPTKATFSTSQHTRSSTKIRAAIALICLIVSLLAALFFGHGLSGLWLTARLIDVTPGSSAVREPPSVYGIPGSLGSASIYNTTPEIPDLEKMNILLSAQMENFADWRIPFPAANRTEVPFFWSVPKAGGSVVQRILGQCLGFVEVSSLGQGHTEPSLQVFETPTGIRYLNVDPTNMGGIQRAKDFHLAQSGLVDVVFTPLIVPFADVFNPTNKGRCFTILRHPIDRSMSIYQSALQTDPAAADSSLAHFAATSLPNNEMVRLLTNKGPTDDLTDSDLYVAMEILRRKCIVGFVERMQESMVRFHEYFGWYSLMVDGVSQCQSELLAPAANAIPPPKQGSEASNLLIAQNRLDLRLYDYALHLFDLQGGNTVGA